jgi:hypothetical protein
MTFRTSGRGHGDSAFGVSGFRVSRSSGTLDLCCDTSLALVSNFVRDAEWQNWSSQGRPTGLSLILERSRRAATRSC